MKADYTAERREDNIRGDGDNRQMKADYTWRGEGSDPHTDGDNRQMKADYTMYESAEKR